MHETTNATTNGNTREQSSHNAGRNKCNQNTTLGNRAAASTMQQTQSTTATLGNKAATTPDATNATRRQHPGTTQLQRTMQPVQPNSNPEDKAARTQDATNATKIATLGNNAATMHGATNATTNSNTREQSSHNARREKRNQQQQHSGIAATTHRATNATNQQHSGTKQLQCMTEQCNQNGNAREQGRGTMQDTTNATKNSKKLGKK